MTIAVAGLGYVGMSIAVLLAQHNKVVALDVNAARVAQVNDRRSPIEDPEISKWLAEQPFDLRATTDATEALTGPSDDGLGIFYSVLDAVLAA